ncbi:MAG: helicase-related protein [Acidimicrobiia bacterium]
MAVLTRDYQRDPGRHEVGAIEPELRDVRHHFWRVEGHDRLARAQEVIATAGPAIVFTRTRHGADRLARQLVQAGVMAVAMHGGRSQGQRERALREFASGKARALVATDVAARGIHVDQVGCVLHFDLAADHKTYLHRSGRTGRAGATGTVVSLVGGSDLKQARLLLRSLGLDVPVQAPPTAGLGHAGLLTVARILPDESGERGGRRSRPAATPRPPDPRRRRPPRSSDPVDNSRSGSRSLYVGNLAFGVTTAELRELFGGSSQVRSATVITDRQTGRSRGFGFVEMSGGAARAAAERLQGSFFKGRQITVSEARPRRPRS